MGRDQKVLAKSFMLSASIMAMIPLAHAEEAPVMLASLNEMTLEQLLQVEVISASRFSQSTLEAPASVTVIDQNELRKHGYRNLAEALETAPGIYTSYDRNYTYVGVRGFNRPGDYGTRILVLTDGARRNDPLYDQAFLGNESPVEIDWVKTVEFVAGPASSVYGANALFGTVNAILLDGADVNGTRVTVDAGTDNARKIGVVSGAKLSGDRDWLIGVASYASNGENLYFPNFDNGTTNGHADGNDGERYNKAYLKYRWGEWRLSGNFSNRRKIMPTAPWETVFGSNGTWTRDENELIELRYDGEQVGNWQSSARIFTGYYRYSGEYDYSPDIYRDKATTQWTGGEYRLGYFGFNHHRLSLGLEAQRNSKVEQIYYNASSDTRLLDVNKPYSTQSVSLADDWKLAQDLNVNLSLRHDRHSDFAGTTSPRAALIWQATPQLALKAITGKAYRYPNAFERFYSDGDVSQSANPDLKPEKIRTNELAAIYRFGRAGQIGLSAYQNTINNFIDQQTDSNGVSTYYNADKVRSHGLEFSAQNKWENGLQLRGSIAWQKSRLADSTAPVVDSPAWMGKIIGDMPIWARWTAAAEVYGLSSRQGLHGKAPGYGLVNLKLIAPTIPHYGEFSVVVYNLTNHQYYDPADAYVQSSSIVQPRRQIMARWTLSF